MGFRKVALVFIVIFATFGLFCSFKKMSFSSSASEDLKRQPLKNRELPLGEPHFVSKKDSSSSLLKKHIENQWALKDISILKAWEILDEKAKRTPVVVAVVDTGIYPEHPCLKNNLWINKKEIPGNGIDDDKNGFIDDIHGWNFVGNNNDIQDRHGHGTHVSGIIAAQGAGSQSPNCKVIGVAPHVQIMTLKYFAEGASNINNIKNTIKSIKYAVENGADIINYSGGGPGANRDEKAIIAKAGDKNIIFVAALGNEGSKIGQKIKYYPASYELSNILFVQSKNENNEIIKSSNRVHLNYLENKQVQTAPGENIISTLPPRIFIQSGKSSPLMRKLAGLIPRKVNHDHYGYMTGTSQATAVATGVIALVKSLYPSWSMEKLITQVAKSGFGQGTEKIKEVTNQGKKLSAYEALTMRGQNLDSSDQVDNTNVSIPHNPQNMDSVLKNPRSSRKSSDVYDPDHKKETSEGGSLQQLLNIKSFFNKDPK